MTEQELQQYLRINFPKEDDACDWKEMKNLKNSFAGQEGDDVISYVSAIANMEGGHLVIGVQDKTISITGDLIMKAIAEHESLSRKEIDALLLNKLPDVLTPKQKIDKIGNLLAYLRRQNQIQIGKGKRWNMVKH